MVHNSKYLLVDKVCKSFAGTTAKTSLANAVAQDSVVTGAAPEAAIETPIKAIANAVAKDSIVAKTEDSVIATAEGAIAKPSVAKPSIAKTSIAKTSIAEETTS